MLRWLLAVVVMTVLVTGCGRGGDRERKEPTALEIFRGEWQQTLDAGQTNKALAMLDSAMTNRTLSAARPMLFREGLRLRIRVGDVSGAREHYLAGLDDADLARGGAGIVGGAMLERGDIGELMSWCEMLLKKDLPGEADGLVVQNLLRGGMALNDEDALASAVRLVMAEVPDSTAKYHLEGLLGMLRRNRQVDLHEAVVDLLDDDFKDREFVPTLVVESRVAVALARQDVGDAIKAFRRGWSVLPDRSAVRHFRDVVRLAGKKDEAKAADRLCEKLVEDDDAGPALRQAAIRQWVLLARDLDRPKHAVRRLEETEELGLPSSQRLALTRDVLYFVLDNGRDRDRRGMMKVCDALLAGAENDNEKREAETMLLDTCFLAQEYQRALELVTAGLTGVDEGREKMLAAKIRAHMAMASGDEREAITHFREFMADIADMDEQDAGGYDPSTRRRVSKSEVLGLNAKRIADLWLELGEKERAASAIEEARRYYRAALKGARKDSREQAALQDRLKDLD